MADNLDRIMAQIDQMKLARLANPGLAPQPEAQPATPTTPKAAPDSTFGSLLAGAADTMGSGFADEVGGLVSTLVPGEQGPGATALWDSKKGFGDTLSANIASLRARQTADADAHPYAYHGGQVAGAFLIPAGTGAKGALQVARAGAIQGAAYGLGSGEGAGDRVAQAGLGAVTGGLVASALHPLINGAGALVSKLLGRGAGAAEDAAGEAGVAADGGLVGEVTDDSPAVTPAESGPSDPTPPNPADATPGTPETPATAWTQPDADGNRTPVAAVEHLAPTPEGDATIPLHAEGTAGAPAGEQVGSISRAGLDDLQTQVQHFRDEFHQAVATAMKGSLDQTGAATDAGIMEAAERTTLTGRVGSEGNAARKFSDFIQGLRQDYPLTRFILPVFNVPANGLGETLKRVPGLNLIPAMSTHVADLAGENGAVAQAEAHGRTLLGGAFLMAGYLMNQAGVLTGSGPQNPKDAAVWRTTHEPYSIRIGDEWVSYRKLDILGGLLSIPASISDFTVYHKMDQGDAQNVALAGAAALGVWFKDQASMRTATQLLTLGDNPTQDPAKAMESLTGQIAAGMIPASGFLRTAGVDTTDPYSRMKRGWQDYIKAGIPGLSQELEPLRNVLGEPVNRPNNSVGEALFPITLAPVATFKAEPVLNELSRLYQRTGYAAGADPRSVLFGLKDAQDVKLEDGTSLYTHLVQPRATYKMDGLTLKQTLGGLFKSPEYAAAVDADSGQAVTSNGDQSRAAMVSAVFHQFSGAIKAEVAASSPTALKYLTAAAAKHRDDAYLSTIPLDDLVNNPALYAAHGVDPEQYSDKITSGATGELLAALHSGSPGQ